MTPFPFMLENDKIAHTMRLPPMEKSAHRSGEAPNLLSHLFMSSELGTCLGCLGLEHTSYWPGRACVLSNGCHFGPDFPFLASFAWHGKAWHALTLNAGKIKPSMCLHSVDREIGERRKSMRKINKRPSLVLPVEDVTSIKRMLGPFQKGKITP